MMSNQDRAERLLVILTQHYEAADPTASLTDILADARHFANRNELDFPDHDEMAQLHYEAELEDEQDDGE